MRRNERALCGGPMGAQKEPPAIPSLPAAHEVLSISPEEKTPQP